MWELLIMLKLTINYSINIYFTLKYFSAVINKLNKCFEWSAKR